MENTSARHFLFLQGPHGPFFSRLGRMLCATGARVWRVGFNAGDWFFWRDRDHYIPYKGTLETWGDAFAQIIADKTITDLVIYGDTRPVHMQAIEIAKAQGITIHVFEEGYLRPYWVSYERGGSNGYSRLIDMNVPDMRTALHSTPPDIPEPPAHWGDMHHHVFYGFVYHMILLFGRFAYPDFRPHRERSAWLEFRFYLKRFLLMPFYTLRRIIKTQRIQRGGYPYHIVLMQLEHDSAFQVHSNLTDMGEFIDTVIAGFAKGAPRHHHLVFKAHPLETGRLPLRKMIANTAQNHGLEMRVHYLPGGKLAQILQHARTAVTVNSTAAQQVLWRGIPLRIFGQAVYDKPEFTSAQPLADFFANPGRPDVQAYQDYRQYLLETSQIAGGYYSRRGRRQLLRQVVDRMLDPHDPYDAYAARDLEPTNNPLRVVSP